ncbi:hypothetical protein [Ehrlichia japonica]|uniref:hypothetical protein n=1 Tax=Ehrlichia japonica TaxID=391036 RepID=UPI0005C59C6C|nr:hypothetical protein [Ehrlichia japonica]
MDIKTKRLHTVYQIRIKGSFLINIESVGKDGLAIYERYFSISRIMVMYKTFNLRVRKEISVIYKRGISIIVISEN